MNSQPCMTCGASHPFALPAIWMGSIGPFCTVACRQANEADAKVWERATSYAKRVQDSAMRAAIGVPPQLEEADVSRAFVIGFAAGVEHARGVGRRTVKK